MHMPFTVGICLVAILGMAAPVATPDDYGGAAAAWKPAFTPHGFNLLGMRHARPGAGFKEAHFRWIRGWGFNFVRLPLDYRCWVKGRTSANREEIDEAGFKPLDEGITLARKYGLVTMLCLHRIPGEYCIESADPEPGNLYTDPDCLRAAVKHWTALATRYHDVPREELFFNLVNEPSAAKGGRMGDRRDSRAWPLWRSRRRPGDARLLPADVFGLRRGGRDPSDGQSETDVRADLATAPRPARWTPGRPALAGLARAVRRDERPGGGLCACARRGVGARHAVRHVRRFGCGGVPSGTEAERPRLEQPVEVPRPGTVARGASDPADLPA